MKPICQTKFGEQGNCMAACIASILEISIDDVPEMDCKICDNTEFHKAWHTILNEWLFKKYGLSYMELKIDYPWIKNLGYHIICGDSPRLNGIQHAVVGLNGKMVHDPFPSAAGIIKGTEVFGLFFKIFNDDSAKNMQTMDWLLSQYEMSSKRNIKNEKFLADCLSLPFWKRLFLNKKIIIKHLQSVIKE